jgi:carboxyl-terminal processing protease
VQSTPAAGTNQSAAPHAPRATTQGRELPAGRSLSSDGDVWVVGISKGSAADVAGVEQGDQLVSVDGARLAGLSPFQVSTLISNPREGDDGDGGSPNSSPSSSGGGAGGGSGDTVALSVRKAGGQVARYAVPRPSVTLASPVKYGITSRGGSRVGVISIKSFTARAQRDVAAAIQELTARGADELELDLRDNRWAGGGGGGGGRHRVCMGEPWVPQGRGDVEAYARRCVGPRPGAAPI